MKWNSKQQQYTIMKVIDADKTKLRFTIPCKGLQLPSLQAILKDAKDALSEVLHYKKRKVY